MFGKASVIIKKSYAQRGFLTNISGPIFHTELLGFRHVTLARPDPAFLCLQLSCISSRAPGAREVESIDRERERESNDRLPEIYPYNFGSCQKCLEVSPEIIFVSLHSAIDAENHSPDNYPRFVCARVCG